MESKEQLKVKASAFKVLVMYRVGQRITLIPEEREVSLRSLKNTLTPIAEQSLTVPLLCPSALTDCAVQVPAPAVVFIDRSEYEFRKHMRFPQLLDLQTELALLHISHLD